MLSLPGLRSILRDQVGVDARAGVLRYYKCQFHAIMSHNDEPYCTAIHTRSKKTGCEFELTSQAIPNQIHSTILALWTLRT